MDTSTITREEHKEFCKRMEDENSRQNHRIEVLEENAREIRSLCASVEKLAVNMENMAKEQNEQGERLKTLENRDGENWRKALWYVGTAIVGIIIGFVASHLGI